MRHPYEAGLDKPWAEKEKEREEEAKAKKSKKRRTKVRRWTRRHRRTREAPQESDEPATKTLARK